MAEMIREAPLGQIIRFATRNRLLKYPEEKEGFQFPWLAIQNAAAEPADIEKIPSRLTRLPSSSSSDDSEVDVEKANRTPLDQIPTQVSLDRNTSLGRTSTAYREAEGNPAMLIRTKTREQTVPYSDERLQIEREETLQSAKSRPIMPEKTADGYTLVDWYTTDDPANPQNWSSSKKAFVSLQIFLYTFAVYCGSAIYVSSEAGVMERFNVGQSKASLGLSLYVIGYGLGPLLFSPLSEIPSLGRNVPYMTSFGLFVVLCVPLALVDNYAGLLVLRFLVGFMGSPCLATGGATMGDMYSLLKLPYAMTAWVSASFNGPALGPMLSGYAVTAKGWRWSLWEVLWMAGPVFVLMFLLLPETSAANILLRRAVRLRKLSGNDQLRAQSEIDQGTKKPKDVLWESLVKPVEITIKDPAVLFTNVYTSLIYGIYYSFFEAFSLVYPVMYGMNLGETGTVFVCILVSCIIGIAIYVSYQWFYLEPDIQKNGLRAQEHRLVPALIAVFAMPVGLFIFGWTA